MIAAIISGSLGGIITIVVAIITVSPKLNLRNWRMQYWPIAFAAPIPSKGRTIVFYLSSTSADSRYVIYSTSFMTTSADLKHLQIDQSEAAPFNWVLELYFDVHTGKYEARPHSWGDEVNDQRQRFIEGQGLDLSFANAAKGLRDHKSYWLGSGTDLPYKMRRAFEKRTAKSIG